MPVDTSMYGQLRPVEIENPLNALAKAAHVQGAVSQNRLADLMFSEKQREVSEGNALNQLWRDAVGPDGRVDQSKLFTGAAQNGLGGRIPGLQKALAETDKTSAEARQKRIESQVKAAQLHRDQLANVNDRETAAQWLASAFQDPDLKDLFARTGTVEQGLARIPTDPAAFADWKRQAALGASKFIEMNKPVIQTRNTGGTTDTLAVNPFTGKAEVTNSVRNTQSPDSVASMASAAAGRAQSERHFLAGQNAPEYKQDADGNWVALPKRVAPGAPITAAPVMGPDGKPLGGGKGAGTEDERKAAGWYAQANNAWKNMQAVLSTKPGATKPGMLESAASLVPGDAAANMFRGEDRQAFVQASSSLSEALLRAATGAGVNQYEAQQKVAEITPQIGDKPKVIEQKLAAIPMYLDTLKTRAGRAAPKAAETAPAALKVVDFGSLK